MSLEEGLGEGKGEGGGLEAAVGDTHIGRGRQGRSCGGSLWDPFFFLFKED